MSSYHWNICFGACVVFASLFSFLTFMNLQHFFGFFVVFVVVVVVVFFLFFFLTQKPVETAVDGGVCFQFKELIALVRHHTHSKGHNSKI